MQDKGELTSPSLCQAIKSFQDSLSSHEGLLTSNEALWSSPFYKKQNELAMKTLPGASFGANDFLMYTDKGGWEKLPPLPSLPSKKKVCKDPPVKAGDDWWIKL